MIDIISFRLDAIAKLAEAMRTVYKVPAIKQCTSFEHTERTPERTSEALFELFDGCWQDPAKVLKTQFRNKSYDELVYVNEISFVSMCAHHTLPFLGKACFAYLPQNSIVGISKIPRLVECFAHRPQIQEDMTQQIVESFMDIVKPFGCGIVIEAWHTCMMIRGAKQSSAYTKTTALRGSFKKDPTRSEFLHGITQTTKQVWP